MTQNDLYTIGATRVVVGLSQILRLTVGDHMYGLQLKIFSGGGTLEIIDPILSGTSTAPAVGWGTGYPLGAGEVLSLNSSPVLYLAATGATMTAAMLIGRTVGATLL